MSLLFLSPDQLPCTAAPGSEKCINNFGKLDFKTAKAKCLAMGAYLPSVTDIRAADHAFRDLTRIRAGITSEKRTKRHMPHADSTFPQPTGRACSAPPESTRSTAWTTSAAAMSGTLQMGSRTTSTTLITNSLTKGQAATASCSGTTAPTASR